MCGSVTLPISIMCQETKRRDAYMISMPIHGQPISKTAKSRKYIAIGQRVRHDFWVQLHTRPDFDRAMIAHMKRVDKASRLDHGKDLFLQQPYEPVIHEREDYYGRPSPCVPVASPSMTLIGSLLAQMTA